MSWGKRGAQVERGGRGEELERETETERRGGDVDLLAVGCARKLPAGNTHHTAKHRRDAAQDVVLAVLRVIGNADVGEVAVAVTVAQNPA